MIPQDEALRAQLALIRGGESEAFIEVRRLSITTGTAAQEFVPVTEIRRASAAIHRHKATANVYVGAAPRKTRRGGTDAIGNVWAVWLDVDGADALARLRAFRPLPSLVIKSGSPDAVHAWWSLRRPITVTECETTNRRLQRHIGADAKSTDAARILRAAGTLNHKTDPPALVECVHVDFGRAFTAGEIVAAVPEIEPEPVRLRRPPRDLDADDVLLSIPASEYVPLLLGRDLARNGKIACPFHEDGTPSLHAYTDPDRGWMCFGCGRGGSMIDFGAALYGIEPRGSGFHEIRRRLASAVLAACGRVAA